MAYFTTNRNFLPPRIGKQTPPDIFRYDREDGYLHILKRTRRGLFKTSDIAIHIDGACTNNGTSYARAGMGIYSGPNSWRTCGGELLVGPQTSQRADIQAAILAVKRIKWYIENEGLDAENVVLVSDCKPLIDGITEKVHYWRENNWENLRTGRMVGDWIDFAALDELIDDLEYKHGVFVKFWWVNRSWNQDADRIAGAAIGRRR